MVISSPILPGTMYPCGPPGTAGQQGAIGIGVPGSPGPAGPAPWTSPTTWASNTSYAATPPASLVLFAGNLYVCIVPHVSAVSFNTNFWIQIPPVVTPLTYQTPTTGFNYTAVGSDLDIILDPAGTLASGTVTMYATPTDNQKIHILSSTQITSFSLNGNGKTIKGAFASSGTLGAGLNLWGEFRATNNTWYFGT